MNTAMDELMQNYRALAADGNWAQAHKLLLEGVECAHLPARLELARLYKECGLLGIPQQERYAKAEFHYRGIMNLLDLPDPTTATISMELAGLYARMKRPVGVLAMLLRARRHGMDVPESDVDHARQLLMKQDIHDFGKSARDAYDLGIELSLTCSGSRWTEFFLREAAESDDKRIRGQAALALADFYSDQRHEDPHYVSEAHRCYRVAAEAGYPEYITGRDPV